MSKTLIAIVVAILVTNQPYRNDLAKKIANQEARILRVCDGIPSETIAEIRKAAVDQIAQELTRGRVLRNLRKQYTDESWRKCISEMVTLSEQNAKQQAAGIRLDAEEHASTRHPGIYASLTSDERMLMGYFVSKRTMQIDKQLRNLKNYGRQMPRRRNSESRQRLRNRIRVARAYIDDFVNQYSVIVPNLTSTKANTIGIVGTLHGVTITQVVDNASAIVRLKETPGYET